MQVRDDVTTLTVEQLVEGWNSRSIARNEEYQRGLTWTEKQQKLLIDSVLRGYPLPRFYFYVKRSPSPLGGENTTYDVIDGQQRIMSLANFAADHWPLFDPREDSVPLPESVRLLLCPWAGRTFSQLDADTRARLVSTNLSVVLIEGVETPDEVRDLFIRLQAGTALTRQQIRDAWPGNIGPYVTSLAGRLQARPRFAVFAAVDKRGSRREDVEDLDVYQADRQTCAQLLSLFLERRRSGRIQNVGAKDLDDLYHSDVSFDPAGPQAVEFEQLLTWMDRITQQRPATGGGRLIKLRKNQLFSLFLLLDDLVRSGVVAVDRELPKIEARVWEAPNGEEQEPTGRVATATTIATHYEWLVQQRLAGISFVGLDERRLFNDQEKDAIRQRDGGQCQVCGDDVLRQDEEYDHVTPWIVGGRTRVDNGRLVHSWCHARGPNIGRAEV